jgi:biotin carboxyl carrier protein
VIEFATLEFHLRGGQVAGLASECETTTALNVQVQELIKIVSEETEVAEVHLQVMLDASPRRWGRQPRQRTEHGPCAARWNAGCSNALRSSLNRSVSTRSCAAVLRVQLADLEVKFRRGAGNMPAPVPPPQAAVPLPAPNMPMAEAAPVQSIDDGSTDVDDSVDLAVVSVLAKKVGVLHRCRFVGGKQVGKTPLVTEGSVVKNKQPLAFIQQLGTFSPIEVRPA